MKAKTPQQTPRYVKSVRFASRLSSHFPRVALLLLFAHPAQAQLINAPPVLDQLESATRPFEDLTERVGREAGRRAGEAADAADLGSVADSVGPLSDLPDVLSVLDMNGATAFADVLVEDGWRAVDRQWIVMLEPGELDTLQQLDIELLEQTSFADLGLSLLRFRVPDPLNSRDALRQVLPSSLVDRLDRNHIYSPQASASGELLEHHSEQAPLCDQPVAIGMVDTAIQTDHPAFASSTIIERGFVGQESGTALNEPSGHGTAVAGLLVGTQEKLPARLPQATLYNASVFYARNQYAQGATMMHLVRALDWLLKEDVSLINMSLAGPDNRVLAAVIAKVIDQGKAIVAAAGNEGPAAPPLYPAAYPQVISATAVDEDARVYRWANRGEHVDFAAYGVSVLTARGGGDFGRESGTSMAAPIVSAFLACELLANRGRVSEAIKALAGKAEDLGEAGRDPVFGYGLLR